MYKGNMSIFFSNHGGGWDQHAVHELNQDSVSVKQVRNFPKQSAEKRSRTNS